MKAAPLLLLAFGLLTVQARAAVLELRAQDTVIGTSLTLNDLLSSSQGVSADDLSAEIAEAPALGASHTWTREDIEKRLPAGLKGDTIQWTGAAACAVSHPCVQCTEQNVRQIITAELASHLPADSDFAILETPNLDPFPIPQGELETHVELEPGALRHEWADAILQFRYQGELAVTKAVRFHWAYTRLVWQAAAHIGAGDQLAPGQFQQVEMNVLKLPGTLDPAADFPQGKVASHALPSGKVLMESDWVEPMLVARNDLVTVLYDHHGIQITVQARALSSGVRNDVIAVQNLTSHKIFNARVVDARSLVYDE
ncbi:MAG: flagellar basal body P-ring formation chaperone FlgA [Verrucomicrobiota bacterium]